MDPDDRRWSGSSAGSSVFLSESRDRLSSMQALSGSGGNVSLAGSTGNDYYRSGEYSAPTPLTPPSTSMMASGSRRVMALRHEFARQGKSRTVSETDLNYGRSASPSGSPSSHTSHSGGFFRSAASALGIGDDVSLSSTYRKQPQTQPQFRADMKRDQFRRRKAMTVDDPAHQQLVRRSSEKVRRQDSPVKLQRSDAKSEWWRFPYQQQYQPGPTQSSQTDLRQRGYHIHQHTYGRQYQPQTCAQQSDMWSRGDALMSQRSSPLLWLRQCVPELVVSTSHENTSSVGSHSVTASVENMSARQLLEVPRRSNCQRRNSSCGGHSSASEDSDVEPSTDLPRRGRRQAIFDGKSLGLVTDGGDLSPTTSADEADICNNGAKDSGQGQTGNACETSYGSRGRRRSSADLGFYYPGDLLSQVRVAGSSGPEAIHACGVADMAALGGPGGGGGKRRHVPPLLKRNTIADFANTRAYQESTASLISASDQEKKVKTTFSLLKLIDKKPNRSKDNLIDLSEVLQNLKSSEFKDSRLIGYKDAHWVDLLAEPHNENTQNAVRSLPETERKRREAVWELFKSECVFLIDHLMVLKHCFMEPMKKVQVEGHLMFAEPHELFGNLDELCYVSYTFSRDFITLLLKDGGRVGDFGKTSILLKALRRFCQLSRDGEVYHDYCLNYSKAISYLDQLRKNDDFCEFEKWCGQDERCHRLQLTDLLISPMQHCTKVPLLLNNISRYTVELADQVILSESVRKLESSLENLEAKMMWLKNFERIQEIQQQIVWQPVTEMEPRSFIPEFLRGMLSRQPCERLLSSTKRRLLHEGPVTLLEISKAMDMYMFLFDDILLLTRTKKPPRKKTNPVDPSTNPYTATKIQTDGAMFVVYRQPMALDRFAVHDVRPSDTSGVFWDYVESGSEAQVSIESEAYNDWCLPHIYDDCSPSTAPRMSSNLLFGCVSAATVLKNAFVLVQVNRFQQIIGVYTLQAPSYGNKATWLSRLHEAQESYREACRRPDGGAGAAPGASTRGRRSVTSCASPVNPGRSSTGGSGIGIGLAGVNINVLQCEENASFTDSTEDIAGQQMIGIFGDRPGTSRLPNEALLGVPRAGYQPTVVSSSTEAGSRPGRTVRSSSSDAAADLRQDSNPQSPTAGDASNSSRRTSDPLSNSSVIVTGGGGGVQDGGSGGGQDGGNIEIVVSHEPSQMDTSAQSRMFNIENLSSSSSHLSASTPFGKLPIAERGAATGPFDYFRSASSTSLRNLPQSSVAYQMPPVTSCVGLASSECDGITTGVSSLPDRNQDGGRGERHPCASFSCSSNSAFSLHPSNPLKSNTGTTTSATSLVALPPPPTIQHSRSFGAVGTSHRAVDDFLMTSVAASTSSLLLTPFQMSSSSFSNGTGVVASVSACSLNRQRSLHHGGAHQTLHRSQQQPSSSSLASTGSGLALTRTHPGVNYITKSESDSDDDEPAKVTCSGVTRRTGNGLRVLDRSSESTPLLYHQGGGSSAARHTTVGPHGTRRVEVPTTLVCCTPPRRRPSPSEHQLIAAVYAAAAVLPSPTPSPPTDPDDVIDFCAKATNDDAAVVEHRRRAQQQRATAGPRGRHGGSLRVRSRSRTAALMNAIHEKSQSIDLADT